MPEIVGQVLDLELHVLAQLLVERPKGSSISTSSGSKTKGAGERDALLLPPESCAGRRLAKLPICTMSSARRTLASLSALVMPRTSRGKARFSATLMCGKSA
jgi:hypothetical protein